MLTQDAALRKDRISGKFGALEHRHFATIAAILHDLNADAAAIETWADKLAHTNPRFDRGRFIRAASQ